MSNFENLFGIDIGNLSSIYVLLMFLIVLVFLQMSLIVYLFLIEQKRFKLNHLDQQKDNESLKSVLRQFKEVLYDSRKKSLEIMRKASDDSLEVLNTSLDVNSSLRDSVIKRSNEIKETYSKLLEDESSKLRKKFNQIIENELRESAQLVKELSLKSQEELLGEVHDLSLEVHSFLKDSHESLDKRLNEEYLRIDSYLSEYKKNRVSELEKNFDRVVKDMVKDYLKATIDLPKHEEIIQKLITDRVELLKKI